MVRKYTPLTLFEEERNMAVCPKCGKELEEGAKFCDACGAQVFETIFCPNCGEQTSTEFAFCQKCGASITVDTAPAPAAEPAAEKKKGPQAPPKKAILFGGIGLAALVVIFLAVSLFSGGGKDKYGLYLKDGEIVYTDYSEKGAMEITSRLSRDGQAYLATSGNDIGQYIAFSEDGKRIFYPDRVDSDSYGITLYYRNINKPNEDAVKIDSDVTSYAINSKGTQVIYVKGSDGILYLHNLTDKEKIASGVVDFDVAEDCKKIGYLTDENSYYIWRSGKEAVKLAGDITVIEHVTDDLSTIYYLKDGSLYKQTEGSEDKTKIASDISSVVAIYDSGEAYYTKAESAEKNLLDYVDDDMAAADAGVSEPVYPDFPDSPASPYWWDYETTEAYEAAQAQYETDYAAYQATCDQLRADYNTANEAYQAKRSRDSLREQLRNATQEHTEYTLYYFNGTEEAVVTDALADEYSVSICYDKPVAVLPVYSQSDVRKVKLSEISSAYEVNEQVNEALYSSSEMYLAVGSTLSEIDQSDAESYRISSDGSTVYFLDDISDDGYGDLYKLAIADGKAGKPEIYDSDVSSQAIFFSDDKLVYYKNVNHEDYKGDLFIDGEEIDYDVRLWDIYHLGDAVLYYTDWNFDKSYGTLKMYTKGTKTKVADDVHDFVITGDNDILYLYDYSTNYSTGTLYLYNSGKPKKIDDDVTALIPVSTNEIRGGYYGW